MKVTYSSKTGKTTITLSDLERRQLFSLQKDKVGSIITKAICGAVSFTKAK